jgi:hypothetical protein
MVEEPSLGRLTRMRLVLPAIAGLCVGGLAACDEPAPSGWSDRTHIVASAASRPPEPSTASEYSGPQRFGPEPAFVRSTPLTGWPSSAIGQSYFDAHTDSNGTTTGHVGDQRFDAYTDRYGNTSVSVGQQRLDLYTDRYGITHFP